MMTLENANCLVKLIDIVREEMDRLLKEHADLTKEKKLTEASIAFKDFGTYLELSGAINKFASDILHNKE